MIGEKLGSFRVDSMLGTGAMGVVYRATNETTGRAAAVKVISGEISQRSKTYERFRREAEILQQFRHPNIVRFLALGRYQGTSYFAMEYVPGENLDQVLRRREHLPWREVVDLGIQICEALQYAHEHGVVHRDLKPSNLMVSEKGQIKLTDFGIAKDLDATALTATGRTLGTAAYMAPEQIRGTPAVSHKTDLYALGVVFYQMLTGRPPFEGSSAVVLMHCHMNESPPRPSAKLAEIPVALDKLVVQLMAKDPADRPWDAAAVAVALAEISDKEKKGESVAMVWPTEGDQAPLPTRASMEQPRKSSRKKARARKLAIPALDRSLIELGLLLFALAAMFGFAGYMLWPPSAGYLYRNAERLMGSKDRLDWIAARDEYMEPLDRRFPGKYARQTQAWRDRIDLAEAEHRAPFLEAPSMVRSSDRPPAELLYRTYYELAAKASKEGDDLRAIAYWDELAGKLKLDEADQRGWVLLARKRSADLRAAIVHRRDVVAGLLQRAMQAQLAKRPMEAATIRADLLANYGKYTDLTDLFVAAGMMTSGGAPVAPASSATPAPVSKPAGPEAAAAPN